MIVLLDQDGVLADFERGFFSAWSKARPEHPPVAIEERRQFRVAADYPLALQASVLALCAAPGFFLDLPPVAGAIEGVQQMLDAGIDVRICTAPIDDFEHCVVEKYQWIERHFGRAFTRRIILTKDKTLVHGDWLVDDKPQISGSRTPAWRHALFDAPYNREVVSVPRLTWSSWRGVVG